jgi:predicted acetyltransferase
MNVVVERAPGYAKSTLHNLIQLYFHDMSEFKQREVDGQGLFHYRYFDSYWTEPDRYPFLIRVDGSPAGFALVRSIDEGRADMAEFFVLRGHRHRGVGSIAAKQLFDMLRGRWEIREEAKNFGAQSFWRRVIQEYTDGEFEDLTMDDDHWRGPVQRFDSRRNTAPANRSVKEA